LALDLHDFGTVGKKLAIGRNALPVVGHHGGIRQNRLDAAFGHTGRDILPGFITAELSEGEAVGNFQRVSVLSRRGLLCRGPLAETLERRSRAKAQVIRGEGGGWEGY